MLMFVELKEENHEGYNLTEKTLRKPAHLKTKIDYSNVSANLRFCYVCTVLGW